MSTWSAVKARRVLAALLRIGWKQSRQVGWHRILCRAGWPNYPFSFHESEEIGPAAPAKLPKRTGLSPKDL